MSKSQKGLKKHSNLRSALMRLARADIVFYSLPLFMVVLIIGTLAQAEMGLFEAHQKYFAALFFMWGPIPLPGGYLLVGLFTINLVLKFLLGSEWRWHKIGIILSHAGALIFLIGGLLTAITTQESFMAIPEGQSSPYLYDYHQRDLMIYKDDQFAGRIPFETIVRDQTITLPGSEATITPLQICNNCHIDRREDAFQDFGDYPLHAMAAFMALSPKEEEKESEANLSGMSILLAGADLDGIHLAFEAMPKPMEFHVGEINYKIVLGKRQRLLPFSITLVDFEKQTYAGSNSAKSYHADILVEDEGASWPARIEMNKPLRYKGYTFFQSAYEQNMNGAETTILAVVENKGRIFPYLGTIVITLGLLAHVIIVLRRRMT